MSKSLRNIIFVIAGFIGLIILISVALIFFIDTSVYKPQLERAASAALGMEVQVNGRLGMAFFPDLHIRLDDIHIRNQGQDIASAQEANIDIALLPLLHREVRIMKIELKRPHVSLKRNRNGRFNFSPPEEAAEPVPALLLANLFFTEGAFLYRDEQSGKEFAASNFNLEVRNLQLTGGNRADLGKNLAFTAEFACREIRTQKLKFSAVKITCQGKDGKFTLNPVTLHLLGGQGSGNITVDYSGPVPRYSIHSSLAKFRIEDYLKTLSAKKVAAGAMDFSANLDLRGNTAREITQTAAGEVSLRGENLTLYGSDFDQELARFESSQSFNLVDVGAVFLAGPLGLAVTKGYNFASIFRGSGDSSRIRKLFSDWKIERGRAQARDVALATEKNRIALKGRINFVTERFEDVTIALIDDRGCVRVEQKIHGPFQKPVVEKPSVLMSLAGPAVNLLKQARDLFMGGKCEVFYTGSLPAPK